MLIARSEFSTILPKNAALFSVQTLLLIDWTKRREALLLLL